jgi:hypothetical protein
LKDVFGSLDLALGTFRYSVGSLIPGMTRVAWQLKKDEVTKEVPGMTRQRFLYNLSRASYEKEWGTEYHKPGIRTRLVAWVLRIIPKVGPFKSLAFRAPTPEVEKLFMASFNATVENYRALLDNVKSDRLQLANENFDLGEPSVAGQYKGTDLTYDQLVGKLADRKFAGITPGLRANLLAYYKDRKAPVAGKNKNGAEEWAKLMGQVEQLRAVTPSSETQARQ